MTRISVLCATCRIICRRRFLCILQLLLIVILLGPLFQKSTYCSIVLECFASLPSSPCLVHHWRALNKTNKFGDEVGTFTFESALLIASLGIDVVRPRQTSLAQLMYSEDCDSIFRRTTQRLAECVILIAVLCIYICLCLFGSLK